MYKEHNIKPEETIFNKHKIYMCPHNDCCYLANKFKENVIKHYLKVHKGVIKAGMLSNIFDNIELTKNKLNKYCKEFNCYKDFLVKFKQQNIIITNDKNDKNNQIINYIKIKNLRKNIYPVKNKDSSYEDYDKNDYDQFPCLDTV
jgi:hypothetical protein